MVIDDEVGAQVTDPLPGFRPGGSADDGQGGELAGQLGEDGTDPASRAQDQQGLRGLSRPTPEGVSQPRRPGAAGVARDFQPVEEELPGRHRG